MKTPIETIHLFPKLDAALINLLQSLRPEDWHKPTLAKQWTVKDIAAHLLDGNLRFVSMLRDGYFDTPTEKINTYAELVNFLNRINADWVKAMKRISPALLISLLETSGKEYGECLSKLDPFGQAIFSVAWAGESESLNWFHIAREYTEKWHHQMQIREAVNAGALMSDEFFKPVVETFMQAMPHGYRACQAKAGTTISITVQQNSELNFTLSKEANEWKFTAAKTNSTATVKIAGEVFWKLFTKGMSPHDAKIKSKWTGEETLIDPFYNLIAVMA
ncbi:MAG: hypothetical protein OJF59_000254 [Cytophagales bacterium]|jgi:uncharacterized protein (TIGR03083 family)|nr:maleylpyruvate isomerase N-terminal domain-containing protein [Bacteroidota bacterium]WHZ06501.1 MAG: hypothetical protein OJF59_000254 [Cytophagales bacterium]